MFTSDDKSIRLALHTATEPHITEYAAHHTQLTKIRVIRRELPGTASQ